MMYPRCRGRLSNIDSFKRVFQTGGVMCTERHCDLTEHIHNSRPPSCLLLTGSQYPYLSPSRLHRCSRFCTASWLGVAFQVVGRCPVSLATHMHFIIVSATKFDLQSCRLYWVWRAQSKR